MGPANGAPAGDEDHLRWLRDHRSKPPESGSTMLTPWNDPESSFAQRPTPPSVYEHSVIIEVQLRQNTI